MNKKESIDKLFEVDLTLAMFEDWMRGQDGDECTKARKELNEVINFLLIKKIEELE